MVRVPSYLLILTGLMISSLGVRSLWIARQAGIEASEQWDRQVAARTLEPAPQQRKLQNGDLLARLSISRLNSQWIVREGADRVELQQGPGHLRDTALPGTNGNCVIAGHRDTQFRILRQVKVGEKVSIEAGGRTFVYRVTGTQIVAPTDTRSLYPTLKPTLTLVTCYPFYYVGPAPKRYVIRAELISSKSA